jgi:hypothetical protein
MKRNLPLLALAGLLASSCPAAASSRPNIILAMAVKTLSNFSNHAFGTAVDDRFSVYRVD